MNAFGISEKRIRMLRERSQSDDQETTDEAPLDLSNHSDKGIPIDKLKLYELAETLGIPRTIVDREMITKYEKMVKVNLAKKKVENLKKSKEDHHVSLRSISEQVINQI